MDKDAKIVVFGIVLTVLIFALAVGTIVLINGIALIIFVNQLFDALLNGGDGGGLDSILNGLPGGLGSPQIPEELQEYL